MPYRNDDPLSVTRRHFFGRSAKGIGVAALASLLNPRADAATAGLAGLPHHNGTAKRVIFLHQSGGPSQLDLFDYKPGLKKFQGTELPGSVRMGQRITGMTSGQSSLPVASSIFKFQQQGKAGMWMSELIPHSAKIADDICVIKTVHTDAINHDPAITFIQSGSQQPGRPSMGAWVSYGLGAENQDLPAFVVLLSQQNSINADQPLFSRLWGAGFLPSQYQGVRLRSGKDPVLYLENPPGLSKNVRRDMLDTLAALNKMRAESFHDPEIETRISQYEMAYRMQTSVPELTDLSKEPESTFKLYGEDARKPGTYAANCLMARRLIERGVRFVQLYHKGWDQHNDLPRDLALQCKGTDQGTSALVQDLKQRGLLKDTLVVWGGEFGRTVYCQGRLTETNYGRDHHPRNFAMWLAGGGIKPGMTMGETDDYSYNIVDEPVHVHDIQATVLHCLGIDHTKLTYKFQGRWFRLTDVEGHVVKKVLA
ncbi:MAG: DUF1501 domain-containing protein [Bryobacterales bacterium]|nr:DUF1501 domain-containing protein [Bryobacterales bacterium]